MKNYLSLFISLFLLNLSCDDTSETRTKVETLDVQSITSHSATCRAVILEWSGSSSTEFGIELDEGNGYARHKKTSADKNGFSVSSTGLKASHLFLYRAYAMDGDNISYGSEKKFTTLDDENLLPKLSVFEVFSGFKRLKITAAFSNMAEIAKCELFWDQNAGSVTIDADDIVDNQFEMILPTEEGVHQINIVAYNQSGKELLTHKKNVIVYGDKYVKSMENVILTAVSFDITSNSAILQWGARREDVLGTELLYTDVHLKERRLLNPIQVKEITTGIAHYRTAYLPDEKMLDTLFTEYSSIEIGDINNRSTGRNPFVQGSEGYFAYRIPSIAITNSGTILAFAEGRRNSIADTGDIDIVLKRSSDNSVTWLPLEIVVNDGINRCQNPVPVVIPETNRIVLLYCWNEGASGNRRVFVTYSDNEGESWTNNKEITQFVKPNNWNWYALGPCHGIVKTKEPHKNRLIVPCNHTVKGSSDTFSHVIYSDDFGITWHLGGIPCVDSNESSVTELSNGDLMLNMRRTNDDTNRYRKVSISNDGGDTWQDCSHVLSLPSPGCQGSILTYDFNGAGGKARLLFSNPAHQTSRRNNTLRLSEDDGKNWNKQLMYVENTGQSVNFSAYSDIVKLPDGSVGVIYEKGYKNEEGIWYRKLNISELR